MAYFCNAFKTFKDNGDLCDVVIKVSDIKFNLHKLVLAGASEYIKKMFTLEMKEKQLPEIEIHDVTTHAFELCLEFIYLKIYQINTHMAYLLHTPNHRIKRVVIKSSTFST